MNTKIAYLEISPRMSGKTTRLIGIAKQLRGEGRTVVFVTPMAHQVRQQLPGVIVLADGEAPPAGINVSNAVWFYDEFDWLESAELRAGAYYATTAKKVRALGVDHPDDDLLMKLLTVNGLSFQRHFWHFGLHPDNWFNQARASYSPEDFRVMILGEFLI